MEYSHQDESPRTLNVAAIKNRPLESISMNTSTTHSVRAVLDENPGWVDIALDAKNDERDLLIRGSGGVSYTFWCFFLYDTYPDVS
jgi:hypothetical protein